MNDIKRYQNPLDELAECDNGDYVKYSDYKRLKEALEKVKLELVHEIQWNHEGIS